MTTMKFFKKLEVSAKSDLLMRGYTRRTTAAEPRLSELVDEYRRIGFEVEVVEYVVEPGGCGICYEDGAEVGAVYGDVFVKRIAAGGASEVGR